MSRRWVVLGVLALGLALTVAGCGGGQSYGPNQTVIEVENVSIASSLDPQVAYESASVETVHELYSNLVTYANGDTTQVVPMLAQSWEMSPDGLTWTFHLKQGIKFASGNEVTANDVVYSFERAVGISNSPSQWLVTQLGINSSNVDQQVKALDKYTVQITLPAPFAPGAFLAIMAYPTTSVVDSQVVKQHVQNNDFGSAWLNDHSAGSGPYILEKWDRSSQIVMTANPNYNLGPAPAMKRVILQNVAENTTQYDMLQKGDADVATELSPQQIQNLKGNSNFQIVQTPSLSLTYLGLDVKNVPAFAKPEVREAIKWAIDYNGIINNLLNNNALLVQGVIPKGMYGYDPDTPFHQDIAKAKQLLAQAGYANGFTVELLVSNSAMAEGVQASDYAAKIKNDLAQIGITVNIKQVQSSELYKTYRAQQAQMVLANWGADYPDPDDFAKPLCDYSQKSLAWRLNWNDPEIGQLAEHAGTLPNGPDREAAYKQINDLMMQRSPFVILDQPMTLLAMSSKVHNVYYNPLWGVEWALVTKSTQ